MIHLRLFSSDAFFYPVMQLLTVEVKDIIYFNKDENNSVECST